MVYCKKKALKKLLSNQKVLGKSKQNIRLLYKKGHTRAGPGGRFESGRAQRIPLGFLKKRETPEAKRKEAEKMEGTTRPTRA